MRCKWHTRKTWHGDVIGALNFSNDAVARDRGDKRREDVRVLHFDIRIERVRLGAVVMM